MGVYKALTLNDLALFYRYYLCFTLDLRRAKNKHNCPYFKL